MLFRSRERRGGALRTRHFAGDDLVHAAPVDESGERIGARLLLAALQFGADGGKLLSRLREIPHIEFVRVGSKVPVVLPQRITGKLARILRKHRVWLSVHYTHPDDVSPEVRFAADRLADAGIPMGSQTVLLKGINDDAEVMKKLMHELLKIRVKPY